MSIKKIFGNQYNQQRIVDAFNEVASEMHRSILREINEEYPLSIVSDMVYLFEIDQEKGLTGKFEKTCEDTIVGRRIFDTIPGFYSLADGGSLAVYKKDVIGIRILFCLYVIITDESTGYIVMKDHIMNDIIRRMDENKSLGYIEAVGLTLL